MSFKLKMRAKRGGGRSSSAVLAACIDLCYDSVAAAGVDGQKSWRGEARILKSERKPDIWRGSA